VTGMLRALVSRWKRGHPLPTRPEQEPRPNVDAFREDVDAWRAGQREAAQRYRALYGKYFSRHN